MAELEDALVGRDEIDDGLRAARLRFLSQPRRDRVLRLPRTHRANRLLHRVGAGAPQDAKTLAFFRREVGAQARNFVCEIGRAGVRAVRAEFQAARQFGNGIVRAVPGRNAKLPALLAEFLFLLDPRRFDVVRDDVARRWRDEQRRRAVGRRRVDVRRCAARRPRETAHALQEQRIELAFCQ